MNNKLQEQEVTELTSPPESNQVEHWIDQAVLSNCQLIHITDSIYYIDVQATRNNGFEGDIYHGMTLVERVGDSQVYIPIGYLGLYIFHDDRKIRAQIDPFRITFLCLEPEGKPLFRLRVPLQFHTVKGSQIYDEEFHLLLASGEDIRCNISKGLLAPYLICTAIRDNLAGRGWGSFLIQLAGHLANFAGAVSIEMKIDSTEKEEPNSSLYCSALGQPKNLDGSISILEPLPTDRIAKQLVQQ